ncbi:cyclin-dependent kinase G-2-like isoform X2 [Tasmannia lanceolata]|uniref:cyclin-dependent kinase G-2-like isoform X2 n=1 Tax=Tasmannia lanceolata TaxID=3420 RepID=UPI00406340A0
MAAGRHGAYREHEFRDRESDLKVSRKRDYYYSKEEYDRFRDRDRNGGHDVERGRERDTVRVRQRDIKEREVVNGDYHSSSSTSNSGSSGNSYKRGGFSVRTADREPGELSSGSGSDDGNVSESRIRDHENGAWKSGYGVQSSPGRKRKLNMSESRIRDNENEAWKSGYGVQLSPARKRKFSPIVWDREEKLGGISSRNKTDPASIPEKQTGVSSRNRTDPESVYLPPPPPLPQSFRPSAYFNPSEAVHPSPAEPNNFSSIHTSPPVNFPLAPKLAASSTSESLAGLSPASPAGLQWTIGQEPGLVDDEDYVPMRNISASRWADETNSPDIEVDVSDGEDMSKRRKVVHVTESVETRLNAKASSPEPGELRREGSEGARAKSSDFDEEVRRVGSASEDEYLEGELDKNYLMEVDKEDVDDNASGHQTETDTEGEDDSRKTPEPIVNPQRSLNMLQGCRSVDEFERLNRIDEGTYGVVYRAKDKKSGEIVALKKVKMEKEREGFPLTSLREINILLSFHHPSIVDVKEVVIGSNLDSIFMVMEYMEHDLKGLMEMMKQPFHPSQVKCLMLQLLEGVKYLHDNWVLHRDLKTSNLLLNNSGELKICDFGLSRQYGSPLKPYTHLVVTLWYRAPELLLGAKQYSTAIDMWSLGCIMAELLTKAPLFNGKTEFDQLDKIFKTLGTPNEKIWPGFVKLPGVKVNFVKQPLPAMGDSGITNCGISYHGNQFSLAVQPSVILDLTY